MRRSDDDRALHDHPYVNISVVLRGGFVEWVPCLVPDTDPLGDWTCAAHASAWGFIGGLDRQPGDIVARRPSAAHRIQLHGHGGPDGEQESWSLFITGPRVREWGFWCRKGWVHWQDFTAPGDPGQVGPGCGE